MRALLTIIALGLLGAGAFWYSRILSMPGASFGDPIPALAPDVEPLRDRLRAHVQRLAVDIGPRDATRPDRLDRAADYIENELRAIGYAPRIGVYSWNAGRFRNIEVARSGTGHPEQVLIIGAHYDTVPMTPGANDNGSGVAALIELARIAYRKPTRRTVRYVAFPNEELPYGGTEAMGSLVYARAARDRGEAIVGMISLETIGYYNDAAGSQHYPLPLAWFYPARGDFVGFVGNLRSRTFVRDAIRSFRDHAHLPSEGIAAPEWLSEITRSDHSAFWRHGYPGLMVTDTAPFRYPFYHAPGDTPDKLDYHRLTLAVLGLSAMIDELAGGVPSNR